MQASQQALVQTRKLGAGAGGVPTSVAANGDKRWVAEVASNRREAAIYRGEEAGVVGLRAYHAHMCFRPGCTTRRPGSLVARRPYRCPRQLRRVVQDDKLYIACKKLADGLVQLRIGLDLAVSGGASAAGQRACIRMSQAHNESNTRVRWQGVAGLRQRCSGCRSSLSSQGRRDGSQSSSQQRGALALGVQGRSTQPAPKLSPWHDVPRVS
jgi:hypothetical protein